MGNSESKSKETVSQAKSEDNYRKEILKGKDTVQRQTKGKGDHKALETEVEEADLLLKQLLKFEKNPGHLNFIPLDTISLKHLPEGDHETQERESEETDLHKHLMGCELNPGHLNFIPVNTFSLKHLPKDLQNNDVYDLIKAVADLTVRIDVKMTSPHRPEFRPGTKSPYPFHKERGKPHFKTGTGTVSNVLEYTHEKMIRIFRHYKFYGGNLLKDYTKCWCTKCKISKNPSSSWWMFEVYTAKQVVFDDIEASHTSLRLFYDRDDRTVDIHYKVSDCKITHVNIERDRCVLTCVTCDKHIGNTLYSSERNYYNVRWNVKCKYKWSRDRYGMTFFVSHPHGCSKQVSIGQWRDMINVDEFNKKFTSTTYTCPGSSGAHVFCMVFYGGSVCDLVNYC